MDTKIKILHLEDSLRDSELIRSIIKGGGIAFEYFLAENEKDFINILETENIDIILSDYSLPGYNGNEAMNFVKKRYSSIPFIFVSGTLGEDSAINAMVNGATDYVLKHKLERLVPAIKRAIYELGLENQRKLAEESLKESQEMLQKARKLAKLGVWDWNAKDDVVTWTEELYQIAGFDPTFQVPIFSKQASLYTPRSWSLLQSAVERTMKTGNPYQLELELIHSDGSIRNVIAFGVTKFDNQRQIIGLYGTVQDITERIHAEQEIINANKELQIQNEEKEKRAAELIIANKEFSQSEENFHRSISESPLGIRIISVEGETIYVNKAFLKIYESKSLEDFKSISVINRYTPESYRQHLVRKEKRKNGNETSDYEISIKRKNGEIRFIKVWRNEILWNKIKHYQLINLDITEQKKAEEALKNSQLELRDFASHLQNIREEEKIAIAREIHDDLGQILVALKIDLGLFKHKISKVKGCINSEEILCKFDDLSGMVDKTIKTTRRIMTGLRPEIIDSLGFIEAAKSYVLEFEERNHLPCRFDCIIDELNTTPQQSVALFRILQEALNNVIKHAKATAVKIHVSTHTNKLMLEIKDNGIGFDQNQKGRQDSYGMIGMKERVILLEGELTITGKKGIGTCVKIVMPYLAERVER
jgi:PAS domain S-box-containing protein